MKNIALAFSLLTLTLLPPPVYSQSKLSEPPGRSDRKLVYKLTRDDLRAIYTQRKEVGEWLLHTYIETYTDESGRPALPPGNYMIVEADNSAMRYREYPEDSFCYSFPIGEKPSICLYDTLGNVITDAVVRAKSRSCRYDPTLGAYPLPVNMDEKVIEVDNRGVYHYIELEKDEYKYKKRALSLRSLPRRIWWRIQNIFRKDYFKEEKCNGFMVFSKPKYRPGDTIKMKAYLERKRTGRPVNRQLDVDLNYFNNGRYSRTTLTRLTPYRPGMYEYSFLPSDTLKMSLNSMNTIYLSPNWRRSSFYSSALHYEEYELNGISLTMETTDGKYAYRKADTITLRIKATDDNEMPLYSGRAEITVIPQKRDIKYIANRAFIPDILWQHTVDMTGVEQKEIALPDSIFPTGVSLPITIRCDYFSADNTQKSVSISKLRNASDKVLELRVAKGILRADESDKGISIGSTAVIRAFIKTDEGGVYEVSQDKATLPYTAPVPWYITDYEVTTDDNSETIELFNETQEQIACDVRYADGSANLNIDNPAGIPFRYTIKRNNRILKKGIGSDTAAVYSITVGKKDTYSAQVSYMFGGRKRHIDRNIAYSRRNISMEVSTPGVVYPGQTATVNVAVRDYRNRPVRNADITAFGFTSKFDVRDVNLPIYKKFRAAAGFRNTIYDGNPATHDDSGSLDPAVWGGRLGLDSVEYYKFAYPRPFYAATLPTPYGTTEIAPFVMLDGEPCPIHVLYVDGEPRYFSKADVRGVYSFNVRPGSRNIMLRTYDRIITISGFHVEPECKNIISLSGEAESRQVSYNGSLPANIYVQKLDKKHRGKLSDPEVEALVQTMITVKDYSANLDVDRATYKLPYYITTPVSTYLMESDGYYHGKRSYLVGPFPLGGYDGFRHREASLYIDSMRINTFKPEGGYNYLIGANYQKLVSWKEPVFSNILTEEPQPGFQLDRFALTKKDIAEESSRKFKAMLSQSGGPIPVMEREEGECRLNIDMGAKAATDPTGKKRRTMLVVLSAPGSSDPSLVYYGGNREFVNLMQGDRTVSFVMEDSTVYSVSVHLRPGGINYCRVDSMDSAPDTTITEFAFKRIRDFILINGDDPAKGGYSYYYELVNQYYNVPSGVVMGEVIDESGDPVIGASIVVKGTNTAVTTGLDGTFSISPQDRQAILEFSFVGLTTVELTTRTGNFYRVRLASDGAIIPDIVVTGMTRMDRRAFSGAAERPKVDNTSFEDMADLTRSLEGRAAGVSAEGDATPNIRIRGATTVMNYERPLIVIDGVIFKGDINDLDASMIQSMQVLKDASATAIYGARATNGVLLITTVGGQYTEEEGDRQDENESLFPDMPMQSMRRNFHDDAFWKPSLATDREGNVSFEVTYPDDITRWKTTYLAVGPKRRQTAQKQINVKSVRLLSAQLSTPRFAVEGDGIDLIGRLTNHYADTAQVTTIAEVERTEAFSREVSFASSHVDTIPLVAPFADSLHASYKLLRSDGYMDGEERSIPIFKQGLLKTYGEFAVLGNGDAHTFTPEPSLGEVTVHAESSGIETLLREIEKVAGYMYDCNEQMASKVKALIARKKICEHTGEQFRDQNTVEKLIRKITDNANNDDLWGWWAKGPTNVWMSNHIVEALLDAEDAGFRTQLNKNTLSARLESRLRTQMDKPIGKFDRNEASKILLLLKRMGVIMDYEAYADAIIAESDDEDDVRSLILKAELISKTGRADSATVGGLMAAASRTMLGSVYWEQSTKPEIRNPYRNNVELTLAAYRILREAGGYDKELAGIRNYFFEIRGKGSWDNTYASSRILETILPDMLSQGETLSPAELKIGDSVVGEFPYTGTFDPTGAISASKSGTSPVFYTIYQQGWDAEPGAHSNGFRIDCDFYRNNAVVETLKAGEAVELVVKAYAEADSEYVMIEISIPAGCSYEDTGRSWFPWETHREYMKEKVAIFCSRLSRGEHEFKVRLIPRFTGTYTLNPASASLMYFPTFSGNNETGTIPIRR